MGHSKSSYKMEIHSILGLPQETRKISNGQSSFILKETRKRITKPKVSIRRGIIKIIATINKI